MISNNPWEVSNLECFLFYCCPECDFKSQNVQSFGSHAHLKHPNAQEAIEKMSQVAEVIKKHGQTKNHECQKCGKYFTSIKRWAQHMKSDHGDAKPFKCEFCNMGFVHSFDVQRHVDRIHGNERPFQCEFCEQTFVRNYELIQHLKSKHSEFVTNQNTTEPKEDYATKWKCDPCGAIFFVKTHLEKHNQKFHQTEFQCEICEKTLKTKHDLKRHKDSVHDKKKPFLCSLCFADFPRKSNCKSHLKLVHGKDESDLIIGKEIFLFQINYYW